MDILKKGKQNSQTTLNQDFKTIQETQSTTELVEIAETPTEEVENFAEIIPMSTIFQNNQQPIQENTNSGLSQDELFAKLQNYKKLLDNGLIMQGEYDNFKKEILSQM